MPVLWSLLFITLATGCTTLKQFIGLTLNPPTVTLEDVQLANASFNSIDIDLILDIHNRNDVDLSFRDLKYKATMFDVKLTEGVFKETIVAKAEAHTPFTVSLKIPTEEAAKVAQQLLFGTGREGILYLDAKASFITDAGDIVVDFSDEKKLTK